ncbi:Ankyrin repeat domain-containing protein [Plasmodiophora brassicae]|uniref:Uncharacterized protein n=1 Tax=Plasmodiophora brassicae TaxID=37360 RepID=A0A0G4INL3_PLABS|nr:hypothetical protein PBRA_005507 [Plasmodiophora brassicae]
MVIVGLSGRVDALIITLRSASDADVDYAVDAWTAASHSKVLDGLIGDLGDRVGRVQVPNIASSELQLIVEFMNATAVEEVDLALEWVENRLAALTGDTLCRLLIAADFLDMRSLLVAVASTKRARDDIAMIAATMHADVLHYVMGIVRLCHFARMDGQRSLWRRLRYALVVQDGVGFVNQAPWVAHLNLLNWAVAYKEELIVQLLVSLPGIDVNACSCSATFKRTPLHEAVFTGQARVVEMLLRARGIDVNARDTTNRTALHWVRNPNSHVVINLLLNASGVDVSARDMYERTPLHDLVYRGTLQAVEALLQIGDVDINARDVHEMTPLHEAVFSRDGDIELLLKPPGIRHAIVALLLKAPRIDVNARDQHQMTPLHRAIQAGRIRTVQLLLMAPGVDVNARDGQQQTPLHKATMRSRAHVELLLRVPGIDVNAADSLQMTPLHLATALNRPDIVELLVALPSISINVEDSFQRTPLDIAKASRYQPIVSLLKPRHGTLKRLMKRLTSLRWLLW